MALLLKAAPSFEALNGFLKNPKAVYQDIVTNAAKETGVNPSAFHKYFQVTFGQKGIQVEAIKENMSDPVWIQKAQKKLDEQQQKRKELIKKQTRSLIEGRKKKLAFFWA